MSKLRQIIREEVKKSIREQSSKTQKELIGISKQKPSAGRFSLREENLSKVDMRVANLFAYVGIPAPGSAPYTPDEKDVKRYGQKVVDRAVEMFPKIQNLTKKLESISKELLQLEQTIEAKLLLAAYEEDAAYGGYSDEDISELKDLL